MTGEAREFIDWLKQCQACGLAHEYREISEPGAKAVQRTWADPDDGHVYNPGINIYEINRLTVLMHEWVSGLLKEEPAEISGPEELQAADG